MYRLYTAINLLGIVTGDLKSITDSRILSIICKGPRYRFTQTTQNIKKLLAHQKNVVIAGANENMLNLML